MRGVLRAGGRQAAGPLAAVALSLTVVACTGSPTSSATASPIDLVECEIGLGPGPPFELFETARVREADHVGVRTSYRDPKGRRLHLTAGISGDFGEGADPAGRFTGATGEEASLAGRGSDWVLVWSGSPPCGTRTAGGNGFTRSEFLAALENAGVLAPEG